MFKKKKEERKETLLCFTWFALQELLKVENCLVIVLLPKHNVSHHLRTNIWKKLGLYICSKEKVMVTIVVAVGQNKPALRLH